MKTEDIKSFFKHIIIIFKEFRKLPNVWLYISLSIVLTVFFLLLTFPYAALIRNGLQSAGESIGRSASIGKINFSLVSGATIENMTIILKDGSELSFQNTNINAGIFSALIKKSVNGDLKIGNIKYEKDKMSINAVAGSNFNLKFSTFSEIPGGRIGIELQNVIASGITVKGFDIPPVRFTSVTAGLNILNKKITIEDFSLSGPDLKGKISGTLTLAKFFPQSQLNLNLTVDSTSPFLENYKILLGQWIDESNNIGLSIRGPVSNPRIETSGQKNKTRSQGAGTFDEDNGPAPETIMPKSNNNGNSRKTPAVVTRRPNRAIPQPSRNIQTEDARDVRDIAPPGGPTADPEPAADSPDENSSAEE